MKDVQNVFKRTKIGNIDVKNHFIRSATFEGKATEDGLPTKEITDLYVKLVDGNVGTVITSYTYITNYEHPQKNQLGIYRDDMIPAYKEMVDTVHAHGGKIVMQIVHGSSWGQGYPEKAKILGPSAVTFKRSGLTPKEMTVDEIHEVEQYFADAAVRVKKAGFDGVELHAAHSYLLAQFLSSLYNHRTDEYGGNRENRFRMIGETYQKVRAAVGEDFPVWIKINSSDEEEGGFTVEEFLEDAVELSKLGIDAIEISGEQWSAHKPSERAYYKEPAEKLAALVQTPVILTGGLRTLDAISDIYEHSNIEFFGFARPFMMNTDFVKELEAQVK